MSQTELRVTLQEVSPEDYLLSCLRNYSNPLHKDGTTGILTSYGLFGAF